MFLPALCILLALPLGEGDFLPGADSYMAAVEALEAGRGELARSAFEALSVAGGPLAPYAAVRAAECRARSDAGQALGELLALAAEHKDHPAGHMAVAAAARLLADAKRHEEAAPLFNQLTALEPRLWWLERHEWARAENALRIPAFEEEGYVFLRQKAAGAPFAGDRIRAARLLGASPRAQDRLVAALGLLRSGQTDEGGRVLASAARDFLRPPGGALDLSRELVESLLTGPGDDGSAGTDRAAEAHQWERLWLLYQVRRHVIRDEVDDARRLAETLARQHPGTVETGEALWTLAWRYHRLERTGDALAVLELIPDAAPAYVRADNALWHAGMFLRGMGRREDALARFNRLSTDYPHSRLAPGARYNSAHLLEDLGRNAEAREAFRQAAEGPVGDFHAHRALARLAEEQEEAPRGIGFAGLELFLGVRPLAPAPLPEPPAELLATTEVRRLAFFGHYGLPEAEWEVLALLSRHAGGGYALHRLLAEAGLAASAMDAAAAPNPGPGDASTPLELLRVMYPRAYWREVQATARETGLDPYLILSVARQESTFRPNLTSSAGARGIMQVMPSTATWLAEINRNVSPEQAASLHRPAHGFRVGAHYLARMLNQHDGNYVLALAAYNGGQGNVRKWRRSFDDSDMDLFIDAIPFSETRHYVRTVLGNLAAYHSLYAE